MEGVRCTGERTTDGLTTAWINSREGASMAIGTRLPAGAEFDAHPVLPTPCTQASFTLVCPPQVPPPSLLGRLKVRLQKDHRGRKWMSRERGWPTLHDKARRNRKGRDDLSVTRILDPSIDGATSAPWRFCPGRLSICSRQTAGDSSSCRTLFYHT